MLSLLLFVAAISSHSTSASSLTGGSDGSGADEFPMAKLSNGDTLLPLVGVGVGNLHHELIPDVLGSGVRGLGHRLVDTAAASRNERIVADAISSGGGEGDGEEDAVHVVTKVWYTHLGYERTRLSVSESLSNLGGGEGKRPIKVHVLLHWPRCYDQISWMDCEGEEELLPQYVNDAGPAPHLEKKGAWRGSWKALEDMYAPLDGDSASSGGPPMSFGSAEIVSIGVSNFEVDDVRTLLAESRIKPHIYQGNAWTLLHDPTLVKLLNLNGVHFQAFNVMNGIMGQGTRAPNAMTLLEGIGRELYAAAVNSPDGRKYESMPPFSASTVVLAWLVQSGVSVVPRAASSDHRRINSPFSVASVPTLSEKGRRDVERAASALMRGEDIDHPSPMGADAVSVSFHNTLENSHLRVFWIHAETGEEVPQHPDPIKPGEGINLASHPGHRFAAYAEEGEGGEGTRKRREFLVKSDYGDHQRFAFEEL